MIRQSDIESARLQRKILQRLGEQVPDDVNRLAEHEDVPLSENDPKHSEGTVRDVLSAALAGSALSMSERWHKILRFDQHDANFGFDFQQTIGENSAIIIAYNDPDAESIAGPPKLEKQ